MKRIHDDDEVEMLLKRFYSSSAPAAEFVSSLRTRTRDEAARRHGVATASRRKSKAWRILRAAAGIGTIAAALVVAVILSSDSTGHAMGFDDVVERFKTVRTVRFTEITEFPGRKRQEVKVSIISPRLRRNVDSNGTVHVIDVRKGKILTLVPKNKSARILAIEPRPKADLIRNVLDPFAAVSAAGPELPITSTRSLPGKSIDGKRVTGILIAFKHVEYKSDVEMTIWADRKSRLPVRIESVWNYVGPLSKKDAKNFSGGKRMTVLMKDFFFDEPLDESAFLLDAPAGYRLLGP